MSLQLLGVVDGFVAVNLHAVFAVDPAADANVPLLYPVGYPNVEHAGHALPFL